MNDHELRTFEDNCETLKDFGLIRKCELCGDWVRVSYWNDAAVLARIRARKRKGYLANTGATDLRSSLQKTYNEIGMSCYHEYLMDKEP